MVRSKASSKKQKKPGLDFKKIKRKLGRKLPPPKNATDTEIKSKAIVLPEQSVAANKDGLALSKKGLTLKELLQKTSHYNAKVRKDALVGVKDLLHNYPSELQQHKYIIMEKLRERISDDDRLVRETLYQLFKSIIFPGCKEDTQGPFVALIMTYIFNAMTHLGLDIRLSAFKYFDLILQYYPATFLIYAEKILQNYKDIIEKNQLFILDKGKLKIALSGLVRCMLLLPSDKRRSGSLEKSSLFSGTMYAYEPDAPEKQNDLFHIINKLKELVGVLLACFQEFIQLVHGTPSLDGQSFDCIYSILQSIAHATKFFAYESGKGHMDSAPICKIADMMIFDQNMTALLMKKLFCLFPLSPAHCLSNKDDDRYFILNTIIVEIFLQLSGWVTAPAGFWDKLLEFIESVLLGKIASSGRSGEAVWEKNVFLLLPFISKLISQTDYNWKVRLLKAFTKTFEDCKPDSSLKLVCISVIEEICTSREDLQLLSINDETVYSYQISWIRALPKLLIQLGDKHPSSSRIVLQLLLRLGQCGFIGSQIVEDQMQYDLRDFYSTYQADGNLCYGPFLTLPDDCQQLSICFLYYLSNVNLDLLKSIAVCCLCPVVEPSLLIRTIEVLHTSYRSGHIQIADHISFLMTLISRFKVYPESVLPMIKNGAEVTNGGTFRALCCIVCSCLSDMGDTFLVFELLKEILLGQLSLKLSIDHTCAMLRILVILDRRPWMLSDNNALPLVDVLIGYLLNLVQSVPEDETQISASAYMRLCRYYLAPCFLLFERSHKLLNDIFQRLGSIIKESASVFSSKIGTQSTEDSLKMIQAVSSVIQLINRDCKARKLIASFRPEIDKILQVTLALLSSEINKLKVEERHNLHSASDRLKMVLSCLPKEV